MTHYYALVSSGVYPKDLYMDEQDNIVLNQSNRTLPGRPVLRFYSNKILPLREGGFFRILEVQANPDAAPHPARTGLDKIVGIRYQNDTRKVQTIPAWVFVSLIQ